MSSHQEGPSGYVPLKQITGEGLLRAVEAEAEALRIIHVRIQKQLQNLEVEEKLLQHMVNRVRSRHSEEELQEFDQQYAQEQLIRQQQQQQQQQRKQSEQRASGQQQPAEEDAATDKLQELLQQHPLLGQHRQFMAGFKQASEAAERPSQEASKQQQEEQQQQQQQQQEAGVVLQLNHEMLPGQARQHQRQQQQHQASK